MKKIITLVAIGFLLIGCGSSTDEAIAKKIDEVDTSSYLETIDINTTQTNAQISSEAKSTYYGVEMNSQPDNTWTLFQDESDYKIYSKSDDSWSLILALSTIENGIIKLSLINEYQNDEYGYSSKARYDDVVESLSSKYDELQEFDTCFGSDYVCRSDNFSYSLYLGDRLKAKFYQDGNNTISVQILASGVYDTYVKVTYETKELSEFIDSREDDAVDGL